SDEQRRKHDIENTKKALKIYDCARPAAGTIVEPYLTGRDLSIAYASRFRFDARCRHPSGARLPAVLALVERVARGPVAIHRTFLRSDGSAKADIDPDRASLGPIGGGAVRLAPIVPDQWLVIGEGIETTLSVMQARGLPGWAALSATGIETLIL